MKMEVIQKRGEAKDYPDIAALLALDQLRKAGFVVTRRDGNGDFGGRVLQMTLVGTHGNVSLTGSDFATDFASYGVQSYWFQISNQPSGLGERSSP